jgi:hypothetical protein
MKATMILGAGRFDLIPILIENSLPHYKFIFKFGNSEEDYMEMLQGLAGYLNFKDEYSSEKYI